MIPNNICTNRINVSDDPKIHLAALSSLAAFLENPTSTMYPGYLSETLRSWIDDIVERRKQIPIALYDNIIALIERLNSDCSSVEAIYSLIIKTDHILLEEFSDGNGKTDLPIETIARLGVRHAVAIRPNDGISAIADIWNNLKMITEGCVQMKLGIDED